MKTALTGLLLGFLCLSQTETAQAEITAPPGTYFEVQVKRAYVHGPGWRPTIWYRWETYAGPFKYLSQAEYQYDKLADATAAGKLANLIDSPPSSYPTALRLVFIIEATSTFGRDEVIVVELVEAP